MIGSNYSPSAVVIAMGRAYMKIHPQMVIAPFFIAIFVLIGRSNDQLFSSRYRTPFTHQRQRVLDTHARFGPLHMVPSALNLNCLLPPPVCLLLGYVFLVYLLTVCSNSTALCSGFFFRFGRDMLWYAHCFN